MTRATSRLSSVQIKNAPPGKLLDGGGLVLDRTATGGKWLYRYSIAGQRREMGLGAFPDVGLADARKARDRWAAALSEGLDPITERKRQIEIERAEANRKNPSLSEVTDTVFDAIKAGLRGEGTRGRWRSPLDIHVLPKIGKRQISSIIAADIRDTLKPIWKAKNATAEKAIQRLGIIFRQGRLMGYQCDPFTLEQARHMLGVVIRAPVGIVSTSWQDIPALFAKLDGGTVAHAALRLAILTCARTDSLRGVRFSEIDGEVWTVPPSRMKSGEAFRYPLTAAAMQIVTHRAQFATDDFVFPSYRRGQCISETALLKALNTLGEAGRPHGFRTSFRTWAQDTEACTYDVAETVLAHKIGNKTERSYARSDLLDRRRIVMQKWADHVTATPAQIVQLRRG